jgi:hypothetical protein
MCIVVRSEQQHVCKGFKKITNGASKFLCNFSGTGHKPPEDGAVLSKHVGAV